MLITAEELGILFKRRFADRHQEFPSMRCVYARRGITKPSKYIVVMDSKATEAECTRLGTILGRIFADTDYHTDVVRYFSPLNCDYVVWEKKANYGRYNPDM